MHDLAILVLFCILPVLNLFSEKGRIELVVQQKQVF